TRQRGRGWRRCGRSRRRTRGRPAGAGRICGRRFRTIRGGRHTSMAVRVSGVHAGSTCCRWAPMGCRAARVRTRTSKAEGESVPTFAYRAVDATGRRARGRISAATERAVARELETRGLLVLDVAESAEREGEGFSFGRRRAVLDFTRSVAALLPAGMPLSR